MVVDLLRGTAATSAGRVAAVPPRAVTGAAVLGAAVLGLALLAPVVFVGGVLLAQAVQDPGSYDPVRQTVSTLAGRGAADRGAMTGALFALGTIFLLVAAGLRSVPWPARVVLGVGAVAEIGTALAPQPASGSSGVHMTLVTVGVLAFVTWPLAVAADRTLDRGLRRGSVAATAAMGAALVWLCVQAWTDGTWLGVAERVLLLAQMVWPVRTAAWSWRVSRGRPARSTGPERMTLALALVPPGVFAVGLAASQAAQPAADPWRMSLSQLSGLGATERWIMTTTLLAVGAITVVVALGLRRVPVLGRTLLGLGGATLVVAALAPQPVDGSSPVHLVAGAVAWCLLVVWPVVLACSPRVDRGVRRASTAVVVVVAVLLAWFVVGFLTGGSTYGLSERVLFAALSVWPIGLAVEQRRAARAPEALPEP